MAAEFLNHEWNFTFTPPPTHTHYFPFHIDTYAKSTPGPAMRVPQRALDICC